ncbi:MAG: PASTA domain-containing protein [Bacteroidales bacterium]|nr:PASTA domain-containing protein [Bacteroidales bacterium]
MLGFITDKRFYIHLVILIFLGIGILFGTIYSLKDFTRHGEEISVPDFSGLLFEDLVPDPAYKNFNFSIIDSIFDENREKGSVISQNPKASSKVKAGRNIYITIVAYTPEQVEMPNLIDLSKRSASSLLETYGLKISKLSYRPDIAKNAVLEQKYLGEDIEPGQNIIKGSSIELVLGQGEQKELIPVPLVLGKTHQQAVEEIHNASLNIGKEHFEVGDDSTTARVYRQSPHYNKNRVARFGTSIELWYKSDEHFDFDALLNTTKPSHVDTIIENRVDTNSVEL